MRLSLLCLYAALSSTAAFTTQSSLHSRTLARRHSQVDNNLSESAPTKDGDDDWVARSMTTNESILKHCVVGPKQVVVYDTSLRDGTQGESISASCQDKLKIAARLASFDMDYIEAGWPGSNPKDAEFFQRAQTELPESTRNKLVAFGSTRRKNCKAQDDAQIQALVDSNVPNICMVAKAHPWQVTEILRADLDENLEMIRDSVSYLVGRGISVLVDLEHFYDGYQADPEYALKCCEAAADAGASCLVLCDTNGGAMPWQVAQVTKKMVNHFKPFCTIGIHAHNDCGMAVANSVSAANAGAGLIQGTINGIGERTGNADLCSIMPSLALHMESQMSCRDNLPELTNLSRYVDEILNRTPQSAAPFVGSSAFAHKGGLHVAAMERSPLAYQHIEPELVGNEMRILISELSGRQNILGKMKDSFADDPKGKSDRASAILNRVKALEHQGYTFEGAEASVDLMILHATKGYCQPFQVLDYSVQVYDYNVDSATRVLKDEENLKSTSEARATIKVRTVVEDPESQELRYDDNLQVSDGNGPLDALAKALRRGLEPNHPHLKGVELIDYKVRILDPNSATGAATRVMIEFKDNLTEKQWTTVSVDRNVISASLNALVDGFEYALIEHSEFCMLCDDAFDYEI
jgi:2-isopropylmalate synthase